MKKRRFKVLMAVSSLLMALLFSVSTPATAGPGQVLILGPTVSGGAGSTLAQKFVLAGKTPVVVDNATWSSMTAAQFDSYDAIVLGDPTCSGTPSTAAAASANAAVWSSVVDGNVVVIGTDETYHQSQGGAQLMEKAAAFSVAKPGTTGAYISLSCYYHGTAPGTPVPLLSGFGTFTARGVGCYNDAHIVATHPALSGLTDATLSGWSCSVHEAFDAWPVSFEVLAIARGIGTTFTAPDGSVGTPYILARGVEVISDIKLAPESATNEIGKSHTLTATVTKNDPAPGTPVVGTTVTFTVVAGPHTGTSGTGVTNASGVANFSYTGTATGTDTIEATFIDAVGRTQRSNRVTKTWVPVANTPPVFDSPPTPVCGSTLAVNTGSTVNFSVQTSDPEADQAVTLTGVGVPSGATMNPALPTSGNPAKSTFSWSPTPADEGTHAMTFTATDPFGAQATCPITVDVTALVMTGRAVVAQAKASPAGIVTLNSVVNDTGEVSTKVPVDLQVGTDASAPPVVASVLKASVVATVGSSEARASVADVLIDQPGVPKVQATGVAAASRTTCGGSTGSAQVATLSIGGTLVPVPVNPAPNTTISLPGGITVVFNEQVVAPGVLTVNAVHITSPIMDIVLASARSDIHHCL